MDEMVYNNQMKGYNNKSRVETLTFLEDWKKSVVILEREVDVLEFES